MRVTLSLPYFPCRLSQADKDEAGAVFDRSVLESLTRGDGEKKKVLKTRDIELSSTEWNAPQCRLAAIRQASSLVAGLIREVELAKSLMSVSPRKGRVDSISVDPGPEPDRHWCLARIAPRQIRAVQAYLENHVETHGDLPEGEVSFDATPEGDLRLLLDGSQFRLFRLDEF